MTTKREVYDFNINHMIKKVNTNTCIILAQCLYLGNSIEWANNVNEISNALNHDLTLADLNKIINIEEGKNYMGFEREQGVLHYAGFKKGKMGTYITHKLRLEIEKGNLFTTTKRTSNYIKNEYIHTPFILSMAIFLGKSIEWTLAVNETIEILGNQDDYSLLHLVNAINNAIRDNTDVRFFKGSNLRDDSARATVSASFETLFVEIEGRDLLNGFKVNKTYEFPL